MKNINKIFEVKNYLTDTFVGREDVINGVLAGLISGEPTLLVGIIIICLQLIIYPFK